LSKRARKIATPAAIAAMALDSTLPIISGTPAGEAGMAILSFHRAGPAGKNVVRDAGCRRRGDTALLPETGAQHRAAGNDRCER